MSVVFSGWYFLPVIIFFSDQAMKNRLFAHTMKLDMFTKPNYMRPNEE